MDAIEREEFPSSTSIKWAEWNPIEQTLTVEEAGRNCGQILRFKGVSSEDWDNIKRAKSKGTFVHQVLRERIVPEVTQKSDATTAGRFDLLRRFGGNQQPSSDR